MTTTLIAKRTRVGGLIETEGDVVVEGRVEGTIRAGGCVTVGISGVAVSEVEAARAMVLGILIGNVTATERIDVAASARIIGDVRAPAIVVAASGLIEGNIVEMPLADEAKPTLRLRQQVTKPARAQTEHGSPPPAARPDTRPPGRASVDNRAAAHAGQSILTARTGRPLSSTPRAMPPIRPGPPPTPGFDFGPDDEPTQPPVATRPPHANTAPAEPAPPAAPRPPSRVRLIPRGGIGEEP